MAPDWIHADFKISKSDSSQTIDLQHDAQIVAGVGPAQIYEDHASGRLDARPDLDATLKALRTGDTLAVWKLRSSKLKGLF